MSDFYDFLNGTVEFYDNINFNMLTTHSLIDDIVSIINDNKDEDGNCLYITVTSKKMLHLDKVQLCDTSVKLNNRSILYCIADNISIENNRRYKTIIRLGEIIAKHILPSVKCGSTEKVPSKYLHINLEELSNE